MQRGILEIGIQSRILGIEIQRGILEIGVQI